MNRIASMILASALLCLPATAFAGDCTSRSVAPGKFPNTPARWGKTDSGPILDSFLELKIGTEKAEIEHGVDLSHHNERIRYDELRRCGATFAIVKMGDGFRDHADKLGLNHIAVMPYHYLSVASGKLDYARHPELFGGPSVKDIPAARLDELLRTGREMGRNKAKSFLSSYEQAMKPAERTTNLAGLRGEFVAVDVEEYFRDGSLPVQRKNFGRFYAAMLGAWVSEVQKARPSIKIVFYTFPDIYTSYLQFAFPEDNAKIHGMPVWLARTRPDGSDFDLTSDQNLQRICLSSSGGNRCILHQYSHRATFAIAPKPIDPPLHMDVDRLFPVVEIADDFGVQIVRRDGRRKPK